MARRCEHDRILCSVCHPERVYLDYQRKAQKRNLVFRLTEAEFEKIVVAPCRWCGENYEPRGCDRVDSRCPYVIWNCQSLCWTCNRLKSCGRLPGQAENEYKTLAHIRKIAAHQDKLKNEKQALRQAPMAGLILEPTTIGV
jgi:hypothetical protein